MPTKKLPLVWPTGLWKNTEPVVSSFCISDMIDFEDCLSITHMERQRVKEIYSYDGDFDQVPHLTRKEPEEGDKRPFLAERVP